MDIKQILSGGGVSDSPDINSQQPNVNIQVDSSIVKQLNGEPSAIKHKTDNTDKDNSKSLLKYFNETLDAILSLMSEKENKEQVISEKINSNTKEIKEISSTVKILEKEIIKSKSDKLREEDDKEAETEKVVTESLSKAIEKSQQIAMIDKSIVELKTSVKMLDVKNTKTDNSVGDILNLVDLIPGKWGKIARKIVTPIQEVIKFVADFPQAHLLIGYIKDGIDKSLDFIKPMTDKISEIQDMVPDFNAPNFIKNIKTSIFGGDDTDISKSASKTDINNLKSSTSESVIDKSITNNIDEVAEKSAGKLLTEETVKVSEKSILKTVLKKIPLIGALFGAGFAVPRALEGDFTGAGMEVASGVASAFPGLGTAASLGIDAALVAKDLKNQTEPSKVDLNIDKDKTQKIIDSNKPVSGGGSSENSTVNYNQTVTKNISLEDKDDSFFRASKF